MSSDTGALQAHLSPIEVAEAEPCTSHAGCLPQPVDIDNDGDLVLIVGHDECIDDLRVNCQTAYDLHKPRAFRVDSRAIARASRVFKRMLFGGFAESRKPESAGESWTVRLPVDTPGAMEVILRIMHGQVHLVPMFDPLDSKHGSSSLVYYITILTDKYDLTTLLRPWANNWLRLFPTCKLSLRRFRFDTYVSESDLDNNLYYSLMDWLWISWELGSEEHFLLVFRWLVLHARMDLENGHLTLKCRTNVRKMFEPGSHGFYNIEEIIERCRLEIIRHMLQPFHDFWDAFEELEAPQITFRDGGIGCQEWPGEAWSDNNSAVLGMMMTALSKLHLWPIPEPQDIEVSASDLCSMLRPLQKVICCPQERRRETEIFVNNAGHYNCNYKPYSFVGLMRLVDTRLRPEHTKHMETQAGKTGVLSYL
ncbi:hypothetical protein JX266_004257 [Neoarthrinium moseri]|nr:hypothetical protein JX266_004257 [Neoarthrinium moseri]